MELFSCVSGGFKDGVEKPLEIRLPWNKGIVGFCRQTKLLFNVPDAWRCKHFHNAVDKETGYRTKSVLAMAVLTPDRDVFGVLQLINKMSDKRVISFGKQDERIFAQESHDVYNFFSIDRR